MNEMLGALYTSAGAGDTSAGADHTSAGAGDTCPAQGRRLPAEWQAGIALARRYASSGPRYTSYPTAPQFSETFDLRRYLDWQARKERHAQPLSLYVHLPFCRNICYYCACNKVVTRKPGVAGRYLQQIGTELALQSELIGAERPVTQLHWGGGTPT